MSAIFVAPAGPMPAAQKAKFRKALRNQQRNDARQSDAAAPSTPAIFDDRPYWNHGKGLYSACVNETLYSRADVRRLKAQGFRQD